MCPCKHSTRMLSNLLTNISVVGLAQAPFQLELKEFQFQPPAMKLATLGKLRTVGPKPLTPVSDARYHLVSL